MFQLELGPDHLSLDCWLREAWVVLVKNRVLSRWGGVMERQFAQSAAWWRKEMLVAWQGIGIAADKEATHRDVLVRRRPPPCASGIQQLLTFLTNV